MLSNARVDAIGLFLYVVKLAEVVTLGIRGAHALAWISFLNWLFFSLAGIVLFTYGIFQARTNNTRSAYTDVLAGLLPTPSTKGGGHVIVLGIPRDIRHSTLWKVIHALSCIISAASVTACYVVLGRDSDLSPFLIWTGFQITWLVLRSTFFFLVNDRETYRNDIMAQKDWKLLSTQERTRLQHLIFALSRYQQYIHPRGPWCYASDLRQIRHELDDVQALYPLPPSHHTLPNPNSEIETETEIDISIQGVIGDTLLSSASWISGSRDTSKGDYDFYDTCIVLVSVKGATIAIPSARVLCGTPPPHTDEEVEIQNRHPPRGGTNTGSGIAWWYWVPCDDGRWLFFGSEDMTVRGKRRAVVLSDREVSMRLSRGDLFASLRDVSEVKGIVENSTLACNFLLGFLKPN
jgi:hypothetical protein